MCQPDNSSPVSHGDGAEALLSLLADERCQQVLAYFKQSDAAVHDVEDVLAAVDVPAGHDGRQRLSIRLHHVILPKLAAWGYLDYDAETRTVQLQEDVSPEQIVAQALGPE